MGGKEGQTGRKACPFYQYKLRKIKRPEDPDSYRGTFPDLLKRILLDMEPCACVCIRAS